MFGIQLNRLLKFRQFWSFCLPALTLAAIWGCSGKGGGGADGAVDDARSRSQSQGNLKLVARALHNYHDTFRTFPPGGVFDGQGQGQHSWQTMLLPLLNHADLYRRVDFDRPWNDARNADVFRTRIDEYEIPVLQAAAPDAMRAAGGFAISHYAANQYMMSRNKGLKFRDVRDGSSNTLMAGEVSAGLKPWGDPTNYRDPGKGFGSRPDRFGGAHENRTLMLLVDGSVREFRNDLAPGILKKLALPADGGVPPNF